MLSTRDRLVILADPNILRATAQAIHAAWNSRNSNAVRLRTVSTATYNMFSQTGGIIGSNIYLAGKAQPKCHASLAFCKLAAMRVSETECIANSRTATDDAPLYRRGNKVLLGMLALNVIVYLSTKAYYVYRNNQRATMWDAMSEAERLEYLETTTDKGNKRLDFRFSH